ncbi:hypothetical protein VTO73DRAFT_7593 [Trametes versicolor]
MLEDDCELYEELFMLQRCILDTETAQLTLSVHPGTDVERLQVQPSPGPSAQDGRHADRQSRNPPTQRRTTRRLATAECHAARQTLVRSRWDTRR